MKFVQLGSEGGGRGGNRSDRGVCSVVRNPVCNFTTHNNVVSIVFMESITFITNIIDDD